MICALSENQKKRFFSKVFRDLLDMVSNGTPFDLKNYIRSIYQAVKEKTENEALAQTYASLVPTYIKLSYGLGEKPVDKLIVKQLEAADEVEDLLSDIDNVTKYLELDKPNTLKEDKLKFDALVKEKEEEDSAPKGLTDLPENVPFSARPNSLNTTTGESRDDQDRAHSYDFIKFLTDLKMMDSSVSGYYITLFPAKNVIRETDTTNKALRSGYVQVITDVAGNVIYFDKEYNEVSKENGKPVFFRLREDRKTLQSIPELVKTTGLSAEEITEMLNAQEEEIKLKKIYLEKNPNSFIIQEITGGSIGYIPIVFENKNPLKNAEDLTDHVPVINKVFNKEKNKYNQTYRWDRGPHRDSIPFITTTLESDPEFVDAAAKILLGDVVDINGKSNTNELNRLRKKFFKDFIGNNSTIVFNKNDDDDWNLYVKGVKNPDIEFLKNALVYRTNDAGIVTNKHVFNVSDKYIGGVPFYKISGEKLILEKAGLSEVGYKRFLQDHSVTGKEYNSDGVFKEENGYFSFKTPEDQRSKFQKAAEEPELTEPEKEDLFEQADKLTPIEQNFTDGQGGRKMQPEFKGKSTMDLIKSGDRTRTTRAKTDIQRMVKDYGLTRIRDLVGKIIRMIDKKGNQVYTRITSVHEFTQDYQDKTWKKEGWEKSVTDSLVGKYPYAIEFEVVTKESPIKTSSKSTTPRRERLTFGKAKFIDPKDLNKETLNKLKEQKAVNQDVTIEQIEAAKVWYESHPMSRIIPYKEMFGIINSEDPKSIANWTRSGITLFKGSDYSDLYHEAWHGFTQVFLTKKQKDALYDELNKKSGEFTDYNGNKVSFKDATEKQLEELLAEDFRGFMLTGKSSGFSPVKKSIFQHLLEILKALFGFDIEDTISNYQASKTIHDLYNNLRIGNINIASFNLENSNFGSLNKIDAIDEEYKELGDSLNYADAMLVVDSIDSFFSEYVDNLSKLDGYSSLNISTLEGRANAYTGVWEKLKEIYNETASQLDQTSEENPEYQKLVKKLNILEFSLLNFGTNVSKEDSTVTPSDITNAINSGKGIIAYHMKKSKYLTFEDRFEIEDVEDKTTNDKDGYSHKAGNEVSMKDLASKEVLYVIRSLFKYEKGKPVYNELGFKKLADFDASWNKIQRSLEGTFDAVDQYNILKTLAKKDPLIAHLVLKLGDPYPKGTTQDLLQSSLWTNFRNAMGGRRIPLVQLTVNIVTDPTGGISEIQIKPGKAQSETSSISRAWENNFKKPNNTNKYIQKRPPFSGSKDDSKGNYLLLNNVIKDFQSTYLTKPVEFLRALGMDIPESQQINDALLGKLKIFPERMMKRIKLFEEGGLTIYSIDQLIGTPVTADGKTSDETSSYKELLNLVYKYTDEYGGAMVSNAKGDPQYELSLRSTISQMIDYINSSGSYKELISDPKMSHMDVSRNPFMRNLITLKRLFGTEYGKKQRVGKSSSREKIARIELQNSSGVTNTINEEFAGLGIASADADEITQILQKFYELVLYGTSEGTRHSDKASTYFYKLISAGDEKHYIPMYEFAKYDNFESLSDETNNTSGSIETVKQFMKYLDSEVSRIYKLKNDDPSGTVKVGNKTYKETGSQFEVFMGILSKETIEKIKSSLISDDFLNEIQKPENQEIRQEIEDEILNYINYQVDLFRKDLDSIGLTKKAALMKNLRDSIINSKDSSGDKALSYKERINLSSKTDFLDEAIIRGYVVNDWIHKYETTVLFYGDPALYNMLKEEFHKRNSSVAATGTIPRTDEAMQKLLTEVMPGTYGSSKWFSSFGYDPVTRRPYNGKFNTAVLEDSNQASVYIDQYIEDVKKYESKRLGRDLTLEESDRITESFKGKKNDGAYASMDEGDGQGWISFDSYRDLLISIGRWSQYQESLYNAIIQGKQISSEKISQFFPVKKMQYSGPLDTESGLPVVAFHKFSLMPLIPTVIKGTNLEILHNKMVSQNIDYAMFASGSKVNTITKDGKLDKFYKEGRVPAFQDADYTFTKNTIFLDYFKDQLETADHFKGKVIFSTQLRKLVEEGLMANGIPTDFKPEVKDKTIRKQLWNAEPDKEKVSENYKKLIKYEGLIKKLTEYKKEELKKEAGISYDKDNVAKTSKKLIEFVRIELSRQGDLADHEIDFIDYNEAIQGLTYDLSIHPSADKIERLLTALVYKRLVRQKVKGEPLIQVSGAGFEQADLRKPTEEEKEKYGTNSLPFYHKNPDGTTAAMKVKISIQGDFKKLLSLDGVIKLSKNKKITRLEALNILIKDEEWLSKNRKMITIAGVRIPVQGLNSMEFAEIYEFLPESAGNIIIVPSEQVAKSGSDFDIDKLTMMFPSLVKTSKGVSLAKYNESVSKNTDIDKVKEELKQVSKDLSALRKELRQFQKSKKDASAPTNEFIETVRAYEEEIKKLRVEADRRIAEGEPFSQDLFDDLEDLETELDEIYEIKDSKLDELISKEDALIEQLSMASSNGIENELMDSVVDILKMEQNFADFITPNGTFLVKPIADKYSKYVRDYNQFSNVFGEPFTENGKNRIDGTKIFEIGYNRFKQMSNSIGKKTLGLGAVDNSYNTVFNRIGAYMNAVARLGSKDYPYTVKQTILMPHNTMEVGGKKVISLSDLYDFNNVNKISTVISQMMNGWVDVAKDSWIFDIQGNQELAPVLLFLVQAGVPVEQAVGFVSQPLVREYVANQRLVKSTFAKALGMAPEAANLYRIKAKTLLFEKYFDYNPDLYQTMTQTKTILTTLHDKYLSGNIGNTQSKVREYTPEKITSLKPNEIFVFGSNTEGRHGRGAALTAKQKFGAIQGQAEGLQGQSYAIVTKDLSKGERSISLDDISKGISKLIDFANNNPDKKFYVTKLGSSLAGYSVEEIKELFYNYEALNFEDIPSNIILPTEYEIREEKVDSVTEKDPTTLFSEDALFKRVVDYSKNNQIEDFDRAAFVHFIELEEMAKATTQIKLGMNFDTTKSTSLHDAREKLVRKFALENNDRISPTVVKDIEENSPIGSFQVQGFMISLWSNFFKLRNHPVFNEFLAEKSDTDLFKIFGSFFKNKDVFIEFLKNDFTSYIFQQYINRTDRFNPKNPYKSLKIEDGKFDTSITPVEAVNYLPFGAFVKDNKLFVDLSQLEKEFKNKEFLKDSYTTRGLAKIESDYFSGDINQYIKFVYERETLRSMIPFSEYKETKDFSENRKKIYSTLSRKSGESTDDFQKRVSRETYEQYLKNTALVNKLNIEFMMTSQEGFAKQVSVLDKTYPELREEYPVLKSLTYSGGQVKNLKFSELKLDADTINIYHSDIQRLADPTIKKVDNIIENERISNLFNMFPFFAFFQSGQDRTGMFSISRIVPTSLYSQVLKPSISDAMNTLNNESTSVPYLESYWKKFSSLYSEPSGTEDNSEIDQPSVNALRRKIKKYYSKQNNIKKTEFIKRPVYNPELLLFNKAGGIEEFTKNIEKTIKDNPKSVFVFDDSISSGKPTPGFIKVKNEFQYNNSLIKDLISKNKISSDNTLGITTKKRGFTILREDLLTDDTYEENIKIIDNNLNKLLEIKASGKNIIFDEKGYGQSLLGYGRNEESVPSNRLLESPQALKTFVYLSERLLKDFGFINPNSTRVTSFTKKVSSIQPISDFEVQQKLKECFYGS